MIHPRQVISLLSAHRIISYVAQQTSSARGYSLAAQLIKNNVSVIEKFVRQYFTGLLGSGHGTKSSLKEQALDILLELNTVAPAILGCILPQLEDLLKVEDTKLRADTTKLLSKIFADKVPFDYTSSIAPFNSFQTSKHAEQHKSLWASYLSR